MEIIESTENGQVLKIVVASNEESLFFLLKTYFEKLDSVDFAGVYKDHHLIDKSEFVLKVKKGSAMDVFKKSLKDIKKSLDGLKVK